MILVYAPEFLNLPCVMSLSFIYYVCDLRYIICKSILQLVIASRCFKDQSTRNRFNLGGPWNASRNCFLLQKVSHLYVILFAVACCQALDIVS
jgi:hypothetical protein